MLFIGADLRFGFYRGGCPSFYVVGRSSKSYGALLVLISALDFIGADAPL